MKKIEAIRAEEIALLKEVHGSKYDEGEDKLKVKQAELDAIQINQSLKIQHINEQSDEISK